MRRGVSTAVALLGMVAVIGLAMVLVDRPAMAQRPIVWKVGGGWPAANPFHHSVIEIGKQVEAMSGGRLKWEIYPAGALVPAFEVLDAVHRGVLDAGHTWPGYWLGKHPAAGLFTGTPGGPFGIDQEAYNAWIYAGGGLELYNELLQKELKMNVVAILTTPFANEPLGWFRKPVTSLKDLRGLKFRTPGWPAEVGKELGLSVVTLPAGDILPALERGTIDGAEFSVPAVDKTLGFHNVAKYYVMPSFHQPANYMDLLINQKRWDELPADLKAIVRSAALAEIPRFAAWLLDADSKVIQELREQHRVNVVRTPDEILQAQLNASTKVLEEQAKKNPFLAKVLEHQREFARRVVDYQRKIRPPLEMAAKHYWDRP